MNDDWKQDPKLKSMNPEKLKFLTDFAQKLENTPKEQLIPSLLTLNMEAGSKGISFSNSETDLLVSIMSAHMPPEERKKLDTLKLISKRLANKQ